MYQVIIWRPVACKVSNCHQFNFQMNKESAYYQARLLYAFIAVLRAVIGLIEMGYLNLEIRSQPVSNHPAMFNFSTQSTTFIDFFISKLNRNTVKRIISKLWFSGIFVCLQKLTTSTGNTIIIELVHPVLCTFLMLGWWSLWKIWYWQSKV